MKRFFTFYILAVLFLFCLTPAMAQNRSIVVSTSMLESAVNEIMPQNARMEVASILPPSACPGHFDLSPRVIPRLKAATAVIRHDYQSVLDDKIMQLGGDVQGMNLVVTTGSPLIPHHYFLLVKDVSSLLVTLMPDSESDITASLSALESRMDGLTAAVDDEREHWAGKPVIAATNAVEYCKWLGLTVVGELKRPEDTTPQDFAQLMKLDADFIVANLQEGTDSALSLGERMHIEVATISNFPGAKGFGKTYDDLFSANLENVRALCLTQ